MKLKNLKIEFISALLLAFTLVNCTDLEEVVLDENLGDEVGSVDAALAAAYERLSDGLMVDNSGFIALQEYTTDEALLPTRGSDWGDGGKWRSMHEFTWNPSNAIITDNFNRLTNGIVRAITAIQTIDGSGDANEALFLAEAKALLAYYTYETLELYGQAPYRDPLGENQELQILKAETAIDDLIADVEALLPQLAPSGEQNTFAGRFTREAGYAFLAEMYLNRATLKDKYNASSSFDFNETSVDGNSTDMQKVIEYTSNLINSGKYSLEANYFDNFSRGNENSSEMIFAVIQQITDLKKGDNDLGYVNQARNQRPTPNERGTNATCTTPEFFHSWDNDMDDPRLTRKYQYDDGTWFMNDGTDTSVPATSTINGDLWFHFNRGILYGQQYGPKLDGNGGFIMTNDGRIEVFQLFMEKSEGTPMDFTPELSFDDPNVAVFAQNQINQGARIFKYEFDAEFNNGASGIDVPVFRLGGMYAMRAEAYLRSGQNALALNDINKLRTSRTREALYGNAPGTALPAIDAEILYRELGHEMYWEYKRRKQMIRFGKFDLPYTAKPQSQPYRRVFPIPQETIDVTPQFTQNQGY